MKLSAPTEARLSELGPRGEAWKRALPERLRALEETFGCELGEPLDGGSAAFVARVRRRDGTRAVLKVAVPHDGRGMDGFERELAILTSTRGGAYVEALAHDREHRAMLLEELGPPLERRGLSVERQVDVLGTTLARAWGNASAVPGLPDGLHQADLLEEILDAPPETNDPSPHAETLELARTFLDRRRRAFDPSRAVLIHGDAHPSNVLSNTGEDFKLIDPEGLLSMPEHDLGIPLRGWNDELLAANDPGAVAMSWVQRMARVSGRSDVAAIWEWSFIERVTSGLFLLRLGLVSEAHPYLVAADRLRPPRTS
ncbi:aminoglycoside phosphotransferase family protein [Hyalangium versicolor]|uniref:aminoglycoside phosphotransferase family protein n=1 Tax=Hyalangium versicolor TaxID=2861190 RepID=UPI001CCA0670|nr:aminoglycoside phosphotransferase family protein [Hyalangium versicolor]